MVPTLFRAAPCRRSIRGAWSVLLGTAVAAQEPPPLEALRFEVATVLEMPAGEHLFACGDFDGDGDPDLLVDGHVLFRNDTSPKGIVFTNVTAAVGLDKARGPSGCWFDFDRDGLLDFATSSGEVWLQDGVGRFVDFTARLGITFPHGAAASMAWGDVDGDGWLDCFGGGDNVYQPFTHFAQSLWLNSARKEPLWKLKERDLAAVPKLRDASARLGPPRLEYGRSVVFCDFDEDGDADVYTGNYHLAANCLWRNDGDKLTEVGEAYGVAGRADATMFTLPDGTKTGYQHGHTIGASWADLDGDGFFDLFVANLVHKYVGKVDPEFAKTLGGDFDTRGYLCDDSNVFVNQGPPDFHFVDRRTEMGIPVKPIGGDGKYRGDELWSNAAIGDLDGNGSVDVFCNQVYGSEDYSYGLLFRNAGGTFREDHRAAGIVAFGGYGAVVLDVDSDGRLDLVVSGSEKAGGPAVVRVFRNVGPQAPWLGLQLPPAKGFSTVGTKVLLLQEHGVQVRQVTTTMGSHGQQNDGRVHFGLGTGGAVRDVLVYWPDGRIQSLGALAAGRYHKVARGGAAKAVLQVEGPREATVGVPVMFRIGNDSKGSRYDWDSGGSRAPEASGPQGEFQATWTAPGRQRLWVRAVRPGGAVAEVHLAIDVKAP